MNDTKHYAFAVAANSSSDGQSGMTMRQYYKAAAITGLFSDYHENVLTIEHISCLAAKTADALLAEDAAHAKATK